MFIWFICLSGMAVCLAQEVVNNAFIDLNPIANDSGGNSKLSTEVLLQTPQHSHRKRKHGASSGSLEWHNTSRLDGGTPKNHTASPITVKIAALEALEALFTVVCVCTLLVQCIFLHHRMFVLLWSGCCKWWR